MSTTVSRDRITRYDDFIKHVVPYIQAQMDNFQYIIEFDIDVITFLCIPISNEILTFYKSPYTIKVRPELMVFDLQTG